MPLIERYILRRTTNAFLLTLAALVVTLWITQVMRELDVVTAQGQAIWIFLLITLLALPALIQLVAPIAFLAGALITLNSLTADNELPVISGAGASRKAVHRPILLLAAAVMIVVSLSHHVVTPASLSGLRALITRIRADVIATLVRDGGFRSVDDGITMHIREKAADGSFHDIFVSDDRNPAESQQYSATYGVILERAGSSYLILQNGDLIRNDKLNRKSDVVAFETYALDLSQFATGAGVAFYKARERSTFDLLEPAVEDDLSRRFPERVAAEIHDRLTAPLYTLVFALAALAFLGRPQTSRQDRGVAIAQAVLFCALARAAGFAAFAAANNSAAAIPLMYVIPLVGIGFGLQGILRERRTGIPRVLEAVWDTLAAIGERARSRVSPAARPARARR